MKTQIHWGGKEEGIPSAVKLLLEGSNAIVTPTKVGYIIATSDRIGLDKKFQLKGRPRSKPGVVLCEGISQILSLAEIDEKILALYKSCYKKDILLGCILPWRKDAADKYIPNDGSRELVMDGRDTSCFVVRFGAPSELICETMWRNHHRLVFASSANPTGQGNRGKLEGVGDAILDGADFIIEADDYVHCQQPEADETTRMAQGVMVSFVNDEGKLNGQPPVIIRKGLALDRIAVELARVYDSFDYRHGAYH